MAFEFLVADRLGQVIGELKPLITEVTWLKNQYGRLSFSLPYNHAQATREFLEVGNRVLVKFDNGLPDWGGVIEFPRKWSGGNVVVTAYSGEYVLLLRQTDRGRYFTAASIGTIAQKLVDEANGIRATGLTVGEVWPGGNLHSPSYHFKNLYDIFGQSLFERLSTADFVVVPTHEAGIVDFVLHVYERRGQDKLEVALLDGANVLDDAVLEEQGPIYNSVAAVGDGQGWGADRLVATATDATSIDQYGLREASLVLSGVTRLETMQAAADTEIANSAQPHNMFTLTALDLVPGRFEDFDVGDVVTAELPRHGFGGFSGNVEILGRTYDPQRHVCPLVVREVAG